MKIPGLHTVVGKPGQVLNSSAFSACDKAPCVGTSPRW